MQSELPCAQRMILVVLLNHADASGQSWPSQTRIGAHAGLSERSVREHIAELVAAGWLTAAASRGQSNTYRITTPAESAALPRQISPVIETPPRQNLPNTPANLAGTPADSAGDPGKSRLLSTQEPPINQPVPTQGADEPPKVEVKAKASKPDWRDWNREKAAEANAVPLPLLVSNDFRQAWQRWQAYRTRRATDARVSSEAIAWTADAAAAGIRECVRAADVHGWPAIISRIDEAISGGWQGLNTNRMSAPRDAQRPGGYGRPRHQAYDASTATKGMTAEQILNF